MQLEIKFSVRECCYADAKIVLYKRRREKMICRKNTHLTFFTKENEKKQTKYNKSK